MLEGLVRNATPHLPISAFNDIQQGYGLDRTSVGVMTLSTEFKGLPPIT